VKDNEIVSAIYECVHIHYVSNLVASIVLIVAVLATPEARASDIDLHRLWGDRNPALHSNVKKDGIVF
jgi:hypothetical protein